MEKAQRLQRQEVEEMAAAAAVGQAPKPVSNGREPPPRETIAATPPPAAATPAKLVAGCHVRIVGLKSKPHLNGELAVTHAFNAESGRWNVALLNGSEALALKPEALVLEPPVSAL